DGRDDEDLGRNFREIAATILNRFIAPHREELVRVFEQCNHKASVIIGRELANAFAKPRNTVAANQTGWRRLFAFGKSRKLSPQSLETVSERDQRIVAEWRGKNEKKGDQVVRGALVR